MEDESPRSIPRQILAGFRSEFRLKKLGLNYNRPQDFYTSQWRVPHVVFLLYRILLPLYFITWMLYFCVVEVPVVTSGGRTHPIYCYFTFWCYLLLNCHLVTAAIITLIHFWKIYKHQKKNLKKNRIIFSRRFQDEFEGEMRDNVNILLPNEETDEISRRNQGSITWYMKMDWIFFTAAAASAPVVTILYFTTIYPNLNRSSPYPGDIHAHAINSVIILLEMLFSAIPIRLLHAVYAVIYGLIYVTFSVIYWAADHNNVLYIVLLDWNQPLNAVLVSLGIGVFVFFITFILFLMYKLRLYLLVKYGQEAKKKPSCNEQSSQEVEPKISV